MSIRCSCPPLCSIGFMKSPKGALTLRPIIGCFVSSQPGCGCCLLLWFFLSACVCGLELQSLSRLGAKGRVSFFLFTTPITLHMSNIICLILFLRVEWLQWDQVLDSVNITLLSCHATAIHGTASCLFSHSVLIWVVNKEERKSSLGA